MIDLIDRQYVTDTNVGNNDLISRQDAIDVLNKLDVGDGVGISSIACSVQESAISAIQHLPSADAIEVVRCKDCKHNSLKRVSGNAFCDLGIGLSQIYGFCSYGERKDGNI